MWKLFSISPLKWVFASLTLSFVSYIPSFISWCFYFYCLLKNTPLFVSGSPLFVSIPTFCLPKDRQNYQILVVLYLIFAQRPPWGRWWHSRSLGGHSKDVPQLGLSCLKGFSAVSFLYPLVSFGQDLSPAPSQIWSHLLCGPCTWPPPGPPGHLLDLLDTANDWLTDCGYEAVIFPEIVWSC